MKTKGKCMQTNGKRVRAAINLFSLGIGTLPGYAFSITPIIIKFHEITKAGF
jgi:hypothetical protein